MKKRLVSTFAAFVLFGTSAYTQVANVSFAEPSKTIKLELEYGDLNDPLPKKDAQYHMNTQSYPQPVLNTQLSIQATPSISASESTEKFLDLNDPVPKRPDPRGE